MPEWVNVNGIRGLNLRVNKAVLAKATERINDVYRNAARAFVRVARDRAPYDPKSRHAKGDTNFPAVHHRDSIRFGQMVSRKGKSGEANRAINLGFFGVNGTPLKYAFIRSNSGRGLWLEKGTSGAKGTTGLFEVKRRREGVRQAARIKSEIAGGRKPRLHYATKRQKHFAPGMTAARRYIKNNLRNVV